VEGGVLGRPTGEKPGRPSPSSGFQNLKNFSWGEKGRRRSGGLSEKVVLQDNTKRNGFPGEKKGVQERREEETPQLRQGE